ncbi:DoxX family protein [Paenibacillus sp. JDR-2]|uniref:DoxX family protein n=1 Tax=Paenibacillus sp. (strain JDR-2) TaxID=324057 RepID=UPI000166AD97|nr:DoxX family protein [Paenibacillus sp. JDR-2]ACT04800.1 DoxX family protein [Paenibacillus sp. JDR-2]
MNITLWIIQALTALGFIFSGWLKAFQYEKAMASWGWVKDLSKGFVAFIGLAELLGSIGVFLPEALGIAPILTPVAAAALAVVVLLGAALHVARKEYRELGVNLVFFLLAALVAIGRF